jgi:hypothetical protein
MEVPIPGPPQKLLINFIHKRLPICWDNSLSALFKNSAASVVFFEGRLVYLAGGGWHDVCRFMSALFRVAHFIPPYPGSRPYPFCGLATETGN